MSGLTESECKELGDLAHRMLDTNDPIAKVIFAPVLIYSRAATLTLLMTKGKSVKTTDGTISFGGQW